MRVGLLHKILILLVIIASFVIQFAFNIHFISTTVCIYVIVMEIISIFENLKKAGVNIGKLEDILKDKSDNTTNENLEKLIHTIDDELKK